MISNKYIMKNEQAIIELLEGSIKSRKELMLTKRKIAKKYKISIFKNSDIIKVYKDLVVRKKVKRSETLEKILRKRSVRTMSGIAPVAVLTMPYPCPGKCAFCPSEKDVPQSYLSNEPAVMRAIRCNYHPYEQVMYRLRALEANGHNPKKIELIVIGGTWSVMPHKYKYWYIGECFRAANDYARTLGFNLKYKKYSTRLKVDDLVSNLSKEQKRNEKAEYKLIGLTLETRPDYINKKELLEMRDLGCTRVELGVQAINDKILKQNRRGHDVRRVAEASKLLKDFGFKVTYHLMPGLPGSTPARDIKMFERIFNDERFQPDQIKFYPTVVTKGSLLYRWWKQGKYKPYTDKALRNVIIACKKMIPPYVRIIRLIRDIPGESIEAGNKVTNLRQIMKDEGVRCRCIRCSEVKEGKFLKSSVKLSNITYPSSGGVEFFIYYESDEGLLGFCRLRLSGDASVGPDVLRGAGIIRELHVYGELTPVGDKKRVQHIGFGKQLMKEAEKITRENGFAKMAVISGIGVRGYYKKLGYKLRDTYMVKKI